jgi:hypothetical protein
LRVIVILFLGITVVALVLKFFPEQATEGRETVAPEPTGSEATEEPRFLPPPAADRPKGAVTKPAAKPIQRPDAPLETSPTADAASGSPGSGLRAAVDLRDSPELAGALLHLGPAEFEAYLAKNQTDLHPRRRRLLVAFSRAAAGRAEAAVEIAGDLVPGEGVAPEEFELLRAAVEGAWSGTRPASARRTGSVLAAMELALLAAEGRRAHAAQRWKAASQAISEVLLSDVRAPWLSDPKFTREWAALLNDAQEHHRWNKRGDWPSVTVEVQRGDSLSLVRSRVVEEIPGLRVCTGLINRVNELGDRYLQPDEELRIPTEAVSTLVDLDARHLFYLFDGEVAAAWEVAIGAPGHETPEGEFRVGDMREDPPWFRPGEGMIPFGDPRNELGTHWVGWDRLDGQQSHYGFHGTWKPERIGEAVSDGCVRMRNEEVAALYRVIPRGTSIVVQP